MKPSSLDDASRLPAQRTAPAHNRIDDIEILRAVAILLVLVHHSHGPLITWQSRSFDYVYDHFDFGSGVDIFFAVSGFVIARSILPALIAAGSAGAFARVSLGFWIRRAWRLLPSAWLWLVLIQIAAFVFNRSQVFGTPRTNFGAMEAGLLNYANYRFYSKFGHHYGVSFPYWTLSLEEQFYILFPLLAFVFRRYFAFFAIAAIAWQLKPHVIFMDLLYTSFGTTELLTGVLIAIWSSKASYRAVRDLVQGLPRVAPPLIVILLSAALAAATSAALKPDLFNYHVSIPICGLIVLLASFDRDLLLPAGAARPVMLWIGSRSYALYLIHIPAFFLTREIWFRIEPPGTVPDGTFTLRYVLTASVLLVMLAEANYRFVETPFRRRGAAIAERLRRPTGATGDRQSKRGNLVTVSIVTSWIMLVAVADMGRTGTFDHISEHPPPFGAELAGPILFERLAGEGWSDFESWGVWSTGDHSIVNIPIDRTIHGNGTLLVKGHLLLAARHPAGSVTFQANGTEIGRYDATLDHNDIDLALNLPADLLAGNPDHLRIDIRVDQPVSPLALGMSLDGRQLGFGLVSLRLLGDSGTR